MKLVRLLKKLTEINHNVDMIAVFQDEVHFQAQTTITRVWAMKGSEPKVMSKPGKNNVSYSGFVIPKTGEFVATKPEWFNYETVIQSLRDFLLAKPCPDGKKYCIILDNAPWHKKAIRLIWREKLEEYADIREKMTYLSLPPYSPDLNPIEQVWRKTRRKRLTTSISVYFLSLLRCLTIILRASLTPMPRLSHYVASVVLREHLTNCFISFTI